MSNATTAISFNDAEATVGSRAIWSHVDVHVQPGEFVAILGPNGAGKSTLLKAVLGLQVLSSGALNVLGQPAGHANKRIGYLPQRRSFDPNLPIRGVDIVRLGLDGNRWGLPIPLLGQLFGRDKEQARRQAVVDAIENVGGAEYAHRPVGQTSGGEQQRLLIAQALVRNPEMLLLDEPLDSLDIPNQHAVASLIEQICNTRHITVMMVAHDINPILSYLDRVIYIAGGRVLSGPPADVIRSETLSELYGSPIEVLRTADGRLVVVGAPDAVSAHVHSHTHTHTHASS